MTLVSTLCLCTVVARSLAHSHRSKRTSSDQRVAEIQALITLQSSLAGHGQFDWKEVGKRKRADDSFMGEDDETMVYHDLERIQTLQKIIDALQDYS